VTALGGAIWVESQVGRGSTFHVDLPVFRSALSHSSQRPTQPALDSGKRLKLLVIDDEPSIAAFIRNALLPHEVATVASGREALAALDTRSFDAVLCDVVMPDLTGVQVYEHVRTHNPALARRFLFISGGALGELAPEVSSYGVPLLYKPFSLRELREALDQLLEPALTPSGGEPGQ
jgi:CheY-like chemotaxis protein